MVNTDTIRSEVAAQFNYFANSAFRASLCEEHKLNTNQLDDVFPSKGDSPNLEYEDTELNFIWRAFRMGHIRAQQDELNFRYMSYPQIRWGETFKKLEELKAFIPEIKWYLPQYSHFTKSWYVTGPANFFAADLNDNTMCSSILHHCETIDEAINSFYETLTKTPYFFVRASFNRDNRKLQMFRFSRDEVSSELSLHELTDDERVKAGFEPKAA